MWPCGTCCPSAGDETPLIDEISSLIKVPPLPTCCCVAMGVTGGMSLLCTSSEFLNCIAWEFRKNEGRLSAFSFSLLRLFSLYFFGFNVS